MDKRIKVLINYTYSENWIGGTYYIQNLISALNTLEDAIKPMLLIKTNDEVNYLKLKELTNYGYMEWIQPIQRNFMEKVVDKIAYKIIKQRPFLNKTAYDVEFPVLSKLGTHIKKQVFWIPDFQEKYYPHFFTSTEIAHRDSLYQFAKDYARFIVFSSKDAQNDFNKFYPNAKPKQFVLNFAAIHNFGNLPSTKDVFEKFNINQNYFLCSNQFWVHKNHSLILKAVGLLKNEGIDIKVVFTGKEEDYRNPEYFTTLKTMVNELGINDNVSFLGFIDRKDQMVLLKNCEAVIQPSLFEGWSTINEDAKAENVYILASNLAVNKEQLENYPNHQLFDGTDAQSLAAVLKTKTFKVVNTDYEKNIKQFASDFLHVITQVSLNIIQNK